MLPLMPATVFVLMLVLMGVLFAFAAATSKRRDRLPLVTVALALPVIFAWWEAPTGEYAGLFYAVLAAFALVPLIAGSLAGFLLRSVDGTRRAIFIGTVALVLCGWELWRQYVPESCESLPVAIGGEVLEIPAAFRPRLERAGFVGHFGRNDRKRDFAQLCRESRNGTEPVVMEAVWITPVSAEKRMTPVCASAKAPAWCEAYDARVFRRIGKILISTDGQRTVPHYYWNSSGSLDIRREGDLEQGTLCLVSDRTTCWAWEPFGDGQQRIMVETNNLDLVFEGMSTEEALATLAPAREVFLEVVRGR